MIRWKEYLLLFNIKFGAGLNANTHSLYALLVMSGICEDLICPFPGVSEGEREEIISGRSRWISVSPLTVQLHLARDGVAVAAFQEIGKCGGRK